MIPVRFTRSEDQAREMICLPLDYLNGWVRLFTRTLIAA
jgi:hypothetical protein